MSPPPRLARHANRCLLLVLFLICGALRLPAEKVKDLKPQGYVNDFANVLSAAAKEKLTALCTEVDQRAKAQIAIVTIASLEDQPVEEFSINLATQWGIGPKQKDRGVLILFATNDHQYRIEVGYGLEGILPDGKVGGFGREAVPWLRQGDYDAAILLITQRIAAVIAQDQNVTLGSLSGVPPPPEDSGNSPAPSISLIGALIFVVFLFFPFLGFILRLLFGGSMYSRRRGGGGMGSGYYGGGFGGGFRGGGGGGGGFGGFGGGSFGGGGASGGW
jgi:uncharacterized protein